MKFKQFSRIVAIGSLGSTVGFLASCKDSKTESADQPKKPAKETPVAAKPNTPAKPAPAPAPTAADKVPVYVVTVSGSG